MIHLRGANLASFDKEFESVPDKVLQLAKADLRSWPTRLTLEDVLSQSTSVVQ